MVYCQYYQDPTDVGVFFVLDVYWGHSGDRTDRFCTSGSRSKSLRDYRCPTFRTGQTDIKGNGRS